MLYLGLVPGKYSSGKRRRRGIAKAGDRHIWKLLTEGLWHYPRVMKGSKRLTGRRAGAKR
jgi:transposase